MRKLLKLLALKCFITTAKKAAIVLYQSSSYLLYQNVFIITADGGGGGLLDEKIRSGQLSTTAVSVHMVVH